jgi:hypothetical protein
VPGAAGGGGAQADLVDVALGHERVRRYEGDEEEEGRDEVAGVHGLLTVRLEVAVTEVWGN